MEKIGPKFSHLLTVRAKMFKISKQEKVWYFADPSPDPPSRLKHIREEIAKSGGPGTERKKIII